MQKPPQRKNKGNHLKPEIFAFFGSTGSGKTFALRESFGKLDKRQTLVWSPKEHDDNYAGWLKCKGYTSIVQALTAAAAGKDVVFIPGMDRGVDEPNFNLFCKMAYNITKEKHPATLIAEEVHTVTRSNGGQQWWKTANLMGRSSGLRIMAGSQRPVGVDKEFFGGVSHAWCGRQNFEDDAKTTAKLVLVKPEQILALPSRQAFTRIMG